MASVGVSQSDLNVRAEAAGQDPHAKVACHSIKMAESAMEYMRPLLEEVYDYVFPNRPSVYVGLGESTPGERRAQVIFDETAVNGVARSASRIQMGTFPGQGWAFDLEPGPEYEGTEGDLQVVRKLIHEAIRDSNFAGEYHEGLQDLLIGTMNMTHEKGRFAGDQLFRAVSPHQCLLEPGPWNRPRAWWLCWERSVRDISEMLPKGAKPPKDFLKDLKDSPDKKVKLYDGVRVDDKRPLEDAWIRYWYLKDYDAVAYHEELRGMGGNVWHTIRWSVLSNEMWGRGPLIHLMPAIKTLNLTIQLIVEKAEMDIVGMHVYDDDGVFNPQNVVLQPGLMIPKSPGSDISPLAPSGRFDLTQLVIPDMREAIRKGLFIDEYERDAKTPLSVFEISQRGADISRDLGPVGGRIKTEGADGIVVRTLRHLKEDGVVPRDFPPLKSKFVRIRPVSPILRAQDQADIADFVEGFQVMAATMGEQAAQASFNPDRTREFIAKKKGIPEEILNTKQEIQRNAENAVQAADAAGALPDLANQALKGATGIG